MKVIRRWLAARRQRRLARLAELDPAERQRLLDQQSPMKSKWGYYPK